MSKIRLFGTSSGYVEIAPAAAASNNTLTAPSTVGEIIAKDAAGAIGITSMKASNVNVGAAVTISESGIEASGIGITCANINGGAIGGRKNLIINGAMLVAQRGTSSTTADVYHTVDRMMTSVGGLDENCTFAQVDVSSGTTPYTLGFRKAFKITNGNQTSGAGSGDYIQFQHRLEAQDVSNSGWNYTSSSSYITLQLWVKSSVAQNFYGYLRTKDGTGQAYVFETGSLTADTWTKITKTIPGNSNITIDNDKGEGFQINLSPFWGTDFTGSVSLNAWGAFNGAARTPDHTSTWFTTNDATFEITGIQLEVGSEATAFEHRTFNDEFSLCQRYFQKYACTDQEWIYVEGNGTTYKWWQSHFNPMRSTPTVDVSGLSTGSGTSFAGGNGEVSSLAVTSISQGASNGRVSYRVTGSAAWGTARTLHHTDVWDGEFVTYSAEL